MDRASRLHALTEELRRAGDRGRTAGQLATRLEVTTRTVKRDIATLQAAGVPVWARSGPGGGYGISGRPTLPPVNFTPAQAVAVASALQAAGDTAPFAADGRAALAKLLDVMDPGSRAEVEALGARVWIRGDRSVEAGATVRRVVEEGLRRNLAISLHYRDGEGNDSERVVEPHLLVHTSGSWFLVAWCRTRGAVRWFRLDRIATATTTRDRFEPRAEDTFGVPPPDARRIGVGP